jgi:transposase
MMRTSEGEEDIAMSQHTLADTYRQIRQRADTQVVGALPLVYPILEDLGLSSTVNTLRPSKVDIDLGRVSLLLALNRLLAPKPLYQVGAWAGQTVLPELLDVDVAQLYDNRLGRALDGLFPLLGEVWARLAARAVRHEGVDLSVLHWDITSFYFQGEYAASDLVGYGYNRDQKPETQQANLELDVTDQAHIPMLYRVLPGPTADRTQPIPHLKAVLAFLNRPELADPSAGSGQALRVRPLLVSDGKMVTPEAVLACHQYDLTYLGPLPLDNDVSALIRSVPDAELAGHELAYRPQRKLAKGQVWVPYRGVWRPVTFSHQGRTVTDRALVVWSAGKARLDVQKRKTYLKRLLNGLAHIRAQLNTGRYQRRDYVVQRLASVRRGNPAQTLVQVELTGQDGGLALDFRIDRARLAAAQLLDGKYALATNDGWLTANDALTIFKGQDGVEKRIGGVKGPLRVRPVFLHTDERIQGLVFFTLVGLLVRAILEMRLRRAGLHYSATRVLGQFAALTALDLTFQDGSRARESAALTPFQQRVLAALSLPPVERYATLKPLEWDNPPRGI